MNAPILLWIYIGLLVVGGMVGLLKAGSKASLIASVLCAVPLILCQLGVFPFAYSTWILLVLLVLFAFRLAKSKKMMPSGVLVLATLATLALLQFIK